MCLISKNFSKSDAVPTLDDFAKLSTTLYTSISSFKQGNLPHTLLLLGDSGTGKLSFAKLLAQMLFCESVDNKPCLSCTACNKIDKDIHTGLILLGANREDSTIKIDDIRELILDLSSYGIESSLRMVIIADAHRMTVQAQNALLKSLEEPNRDCYFILTSSKEKALLPTVISRCTQLRLPLWSKDKLISELIEHGVEPYKADEIASLSGGSIGKALVYANDDSFRELLQLFEDSFLSLNDEKSIAYASSKLKSSKDDGDMLINLLEIYTTKLLKNADNSQALKGINNMLSAIATARKWQSSNVSWQATADYLLFHTLEDLSICR